MPGDYGTPDRQARQGGHPQQAAKKLPVQGVASPVVSTHISDTPISDNATRSTATTLPPASAPPRKRHLRLRMPKSWLFWGVTVMIGFSGLGVLSATALLRLPTLPNCPAIFWPTASASLRMYCAQLAADKRTAKDLLRAIALVNALPPDHPLRPEINRNIELWSEEILVLSEEAFQAGDLEKAISTARKIPETTPAHAKVEGQIAQWEAVWQKAEGIYDKAEQFLKDENLRQAFRTATQLLDVGNQYWETTKYREINDLIVSTRLDSNKIDKAKGLSEQGGLKNLLAAIKLVEEIKPESHLHVKAQGLITEFSRDMLSLAEAALDRRQYDEALNIARQIPDQAKLGEEIRDFNMIAEAQSQAWGGMVPDLEAAIVAVQRIKSDRPLYGKAQQLISDWQAEIQDVAVLERARQIAQPATTGDLRAAIAEAQRIPFGNPRRDQAEQEISRWQQQIETSEDQPFLDRATQLANGGNLQAAITEAGRINPGRALYEEASRSIDQWTTQLQQAQDLPLLDRARQLANGGDLSGAIAAAQQIGGGRSLYDEAQSDISGWSNQLEQSQDQPLLDQARQLARQGDTSGAIALAQRIEPGRGLYDEAQGEIQQWRGRTQGQDQLNQAYNAARIGTPAMLAAAIEIAQQVPNSNPARLEANQAIDQWSYQLLQMAQSQAQLNPAAAIAIAERIPANTAAYATAQQQIQSWRR